MRSDANRRRTDFRPAKSPLFYRPNPEGPAAREMCADFGRCFAGRTHLRRMGTHGDAWGRMGDRCQIDVRHGGMVSRMIETKILANAAADRHPHVQDRSRSELNSSFVSFQSPSGDFAIPLI